MGFIYPKVKYQFRPVNAFFPFKFLLYVSMIYMLYSVQVKAFGPGLKPDGIEIKKKTEFTVDVKNAGKAELVIDIKDQWGNKVAHEIKDNKNGTYTVYYTPEHPLKHTVAITWGGVSIPESPFKVSSIHHGCILFQIRILQKIIKLPSDVIQDWHAIKHSMETL